MVDNSSPEETLGGISLEGTEPLTLALGWKTGANTRVRQMRLSVKVADALRDVAETTLAGLKDREVEAWTPDADLTPETVLVLPSAEVGSEPSMTRDHNETKFLDVLKSAEDLDHLPPTDLPAANLSFYAIVIGEPGHRSVFLRRSNPRRGLRKGRIYSHLSDSLQVIEDPIFAFDEWIDLILIDDYVYVLSQSVFTFLFRAQDTLKDRVPRWVKELHECVPLSEESTQLLKERVMRDTRLQTRLEAIVRRNHLPQVPTDTIRGAMASFGMDHERILNDHGQLEIESDDIRPLLQLLNEDLFEGVLTSQGFRADKKAAR